MRGDCIKDKLKKTLDKENDRLVAYLDILGFKEHVKKYINPKQEADKQIIEIINSSLEKANMVIKTGINKDIQLITYRNFSDCFCFSIPEYHHDYNESTMLSLIITHLYFFNFNIMKHSICLRGGLSFGFHREEEDIIFSEGLIKAYELEKKEVYPRIVIDEELVKRLKRLWKEDNDVLTDFSIDKKIIVDMDGKAFINPFNPMKSMGRMTLEKERKQFKSKRDFDKYVQKLNQQYHKDIQTILKNKIDEYQANQHILEKYIWLNNLLKWNRNPKRSTIKFKYLLKSK